MPTWVRGATGALLAALVAAGCQAPLDIDREQLDPYLCWSEDLPFEFMEQTRGDFTANDLAGLSQTPEERKLEYREAGMLGGRFVFWKQELPRPPFESPVNLVCQVIQFETAAQATAWVEGLEVEPASIRDTGMVWTPGNVTGLAELPSERGRAFRLAAEEGDARVVLYVLHEARGNLVLSVFAGNRDGQPWAAVVESIAAARDARLAGGPTSGSR